MKLIEAVRTRSLFDFLLAVFLSALIMSVEEMRNFSWSTSLRLLVYSRFHPNAPRPIDAPHQERLLEFVLSWVLVALAFLLLRILAKRRHADALKLITGAIALCGFPAAVLCRGYGNRALLAASIAVGVLSVCVYVYQHPRISWQVGLLFLVLYYVSLGWIAWHSWSTFPLAFFLMWPGFDWIFGTYYWTQNLFLAAGFLCSLVWGISIASTKENSGLVARFAEGIESFPRSPS